MTRWLIRRILRRNAGSNGCMPVFLVILSVVWGVIGVVSIRMAPAIWGGVMMSVFSAAFLASAVFLVIRQWRRLRGAALDLHPLVLAVSAPSPAATLERAIREYRNDGKGHLRPSIRCILVSGEAVVLYPSSIEQIVLWRGLQRAFPTAQFSSATR